MTMLDPSIGAHIAKRFCRNVSGEVSLCRPGAWVNRFSGEIPRRGEETNHIWVDGPEHALLPSAAMRPAAGHVIACEGCLFGLTSWRDMGCAQIHTQSCCHITCHRHRRHGASTDHGVVVTVSSYQGCRYAEA